MLLMDCLGPMRRVPFGEGGFGDFGFMAKGG